MAIRRIGRMDVLEESKLGKLWEPESVILWIPRTPPRLGLYEPEGGGVDFRLASSTCLRAYHQDSACTNPKVVAWTSDWLRRRESVWELSRSLECIVERRMPGYVAGILIRDEHARSGGWWSSSKRDTSHTMFRAYAVECCWVRDEDRGSTGMEKLPGTIFKLIWVLYAIVKPEAARRKVGKHIWINRDTRMPECVESRPEGIDRGHAVVILLYIDYGLWCMMRQG
ncbi:hypothetical protein FPV67DRAFT_1451611 [Lyophyllum atratum]|nr:hypothetical protein FPV67DRAFT_1451611 [Lyophyllum atratum]